MVTRRQVLGAGAVAGAALVIPVALRLSTADASPVPGGTLDPNSLPKYVTPLFVLPAMPKAPPESRLPRSRTAESEASPGPRHPRVFEGNDENLRAAEGCPKPVNCFEPGNSTVPA